MILLTLVRKDLLEQWRTKKILILTMVFLFVAISSPVIAKLTPELLKSISVPGLIINLPPPTYLDSVDQFIKNVSQMALLVLLFVVAGAVSDEKNRKTLEMLLTKPVPRVTFIISKFKAYFISISLLFAGCSAVFYLYTLSVFGNFSAWNFAVMCGNVLLYILMLISITILASTIVKNSIAAGGIGFVCYILFGTIFDFFEPLKKYSPNTIFATYRDIVEKGWDSDLLWPIIVMITVIILSVLLSIAIFRRQEIER